MLSRVLGLARDQLMAGWFGASTATDAFNVAFRIPNLLRDLFAEGAMSAAFVPTFTRWRAEHGDAAAWALGRQLMATLLVVLLALCAFGWWLAPQLVTLLAGGFAVVPGKLELTVALTRIMLPFLPLVALAAVAMGMLNAHGVFGIPALAPALLNVGMIGAGLALIPVCRLLGVPEIVAMAWGVVAGGALQFACQLPSLRRVGFDLRLEVPTAHPGVQRVAQLMLPATVGLAATQVNLAVSTIIAASLREGSVSWLYYAFRLMQLPIGVFGVALATVAMPALSRAAVAQDLPALRATLSAAVRMVLVLTVPAAVFLAVMATPVVALLFEHGRFGPDDTRATAGALLAYCVGLPAFAAVGVFTRAFYALGDTRTPVRASLVAVAVNLGLNLAFVGPLASLGLAHRGLALATSLTSLVNLAQLAWALRARAGGIEARRIATTAARIAAVSLAVGAVLAAALARAGERAHAGLASEALAVGLGAVLALALGVPALRWARLEEWDTLADLARGMRLRLLRR
jgi:putative peptidoglycan lipid II flippase